MTADGRLAQHTAPLNRGAVLVGKPDHVFTSAGEVSFGKKGLVKMKTDHRSIVRKWTHENVAVKAKHRTS